MVKKFQKKVADFAGVLTLRSAAEIEKGVFEGRKRSIRRYALRYLLELVILLLHF